MSSVLRIVLVAVSLMTITAAAGELSATPQTGFFTLSFTPSELLGEVGAEKSDYILRSDDELSWQLYVPPDYDPARPVGVWST